MFVAQDVISVEVINNLLVDYSLKVFSDDTKEADGPIMRKNWALTGILENRAYTWNILRTWEWFFFQLNNFAKIGDQSRLIFL